MQPTLWNLIVPNLRELSFPGKVEFRYKAAYQKLRTILASQMKHINT